MDNLERLVGLERYGEILELLTEKQLVVVALRLEGLNGEEIAELLGISRRAVNIRLQGARARIVRKYPELAATVKGRQMSVGIRRRHGRQMAGSVSCG